MIGNDIVDLKRITTNWRRPRFLGKAFTLTEQTYIEASKNKDQMVWLLWSMKEAAYKAYVKQYQDQFFNPKRLECELISEVKGKVYVGHQVYETSSTCTQDYVYTIAKLNDQSQVKSFIFKSENLDYRSLSKALKAKSLRAISITYDFAYEGLSIRKNSLGIPEIFHHSESLPITISLTHCGRFSSVAYKLI